MPVLGYAKHSECSQAHFLISAGLCHKLSLYRWRCTRIKVGFLSVVGECPNVPTNAADTHTFLFIYLFRFLFSPLSAPPPAVLMKHALNLFDGDDIKLESDLTILLWQSCADNVMPLAIGHIQLPDTKT